LIYKKYGEFYENYRSDKKRKSIRKFKQKDLSDDVIKQLLKLAAEVLSAKNSQPWEFLVLKNDRKNIISEIMLNRVNEKKKLLSVV